MIKHQINKVYTFI